MASIKKPISQHQLMPQEETLEVGKKHRQCTIGLPKEMLKHESRIGLTPLAVRYLTQQGHKVVIEKGAGIGANFKDFDYNEAGASIENSRQKVFQSDIIIKISPLTISEIKMIHEHQVIFSSLYMPGQKKDLIKELMKRKATALAFEYIKDDENCLPIVRAMNQISGSSSIMIASEYLSNFHEGKGVLLGGFTGITPTEVVIIGAGTASEFAARTAIGLGATVKIYDHSIYKLRQLEKNLGQRLFTSSLHTEVLAKALKTADVAIGALDMYDTESYYYVPEDLVKMMKPGSVIIDLNSDGGGCFETSQITDHEKPVFKKFGIIHYCVPNVPSRVARTASIALSDIIGPILQKIGESGGVRQLLKDNYGLRKGVYLYQGVLTNAVIGKRLKISFQDIDLLVATF